MITLSPLVYKTVLFKYRLLKPYQHFWLSNRAKHAAIAEVHKNQGQDVVLRLTGKQYEGSQEVIMNCEGLLIPEGFGWDGATKAIDTANSMEASLVHDVICDAINDEQLEWKWRRIGDVEFRHILKAVGMSWVRRWLWWLFGVRLYATVIKPK